jgi:mono/diheme cytochrome c family protein
MESNPSYCDAGALSWRFALRACLMFSIAVYAGCRTPTAEQGVDEGRRIYQDQCMACHGALGRGDGYVLFTPPVGDLTSEEVQRKWDLELLQSIHDGRANTAMGTWSLALSEQEMTAVLQYVRHLGESKGD